MGKIVKKKEMIKTGINALDLIGRPGEVLVYVFYDIEDDRVREKTSRACKDFGLERTQFSGFIGYLSRNRREEMGIKLRDVLGKHNGKILIQPVCEKDFREFKEYIHYEEEKDSQESHAKLAPDPYPGAQRRNGEETD
ncbi:MAG: CRISPR-associated endonuclease Cas2 [Desulfobacterales bacterium]|nr:CRISPR-associated endonuclease Cas2 [Desulfobacterales bacterium]